MVIRVGAAAILCVLLTACSAATSVDDEPEGCRFTYESDSGRPPVECVVPADSEETCFDAALCICTEWNPEGTAAELEECAEWETVPRGAITLSDFCNTWSERTLADAISTWAADRGALITAEPECDDMVATLRER